MDHADVRAWLADAFFRPGLLRALDDDGTDAAGADPQVAGLREHLATCAECGAELAALRSTAVALDLALGPPAAARDRVLANVAALGRERKQASTRGASPRGESTRGASRRGWWPLSLSPPRAAAALAVVAAIGFGLGAVAGILLSSAVDQPSRLANALAQLDERLAEPGVRQATLLDESGSGAGLVVLSPSSHRLAVFTASLEPPPTGRYECYLERDGERSLIGPMGFEAPVAFWAGPIDALPDAGRPGDRFLVLLGAAEGEPLLQTEF